MGVCIIKVFKSFIRHVRVVNHFCHEKVIPSVEKFNIPG